MTDETGKTDTTNTTNTTNTTATDAPPEKFGRRSMPSVDVKAVRTAIARVLWAICVLFAAVLAAAVLLIAIDANAKNELVRFIIEFANKVDLGFFDLSSPIKDFNTKVSDPAQDVKTALFNYGVCAIVWLVIGRVLDRVVRP